jgi:hypothetical protein
MAMSSRTPIRSGKTTGSGSSNRKTLPVSPKPGWSVTTEATFTLLPASGACPSTLEELVDPTWIGPSISTFQSQLTELLVGIDDALLVEIRHGHLLRVRASRRR